MRKLILLLVTPALIGAAPPVYEPKPGEGVICMMGLVNAAAEVGRRCYPAQNVAFQAELERSVLRIDDYVLKNSSTTQKQIAKFKLEQARVGAPEPELCRGEIRGVYSGFLTGGVEKLRSEIDKLLARPGTPSWGDCL